MELSLFEMGLVLAAMMYCCLLGGAFGSSMGFLVSRLIWREIEGRKQCTGGNLSVVEVAE